MHFNSIKKKTISVVESQDQPALSCDQFLDEKCNELLEVTDLVTYTHGAAGVLIVPIVFVCFILYLASLIGPTLDRQRWQGTLKFD